MLMVGYRRPGVRVPDVDQPGRRVRHRGDDDDGDHDHAGVRGRARTVGLELAAGAAVVTGAFLVIDLAFFGANVIKIEHGGWFPLVVAGVVYAVMYLAHRAALVVRAAGGVPKSRCPFFESVRAEPRFVCPGTGIFMTARPEGAPPILVHHLRTTRCCTSRSSC